MSVAIENSRIKSVLIIDDDETFRRMLKTFYERLVPGVRIDFHDPVQQGTPGDDFGWHNYDLLMMDYDLGNGENGLDWLRKYKGSNRRFPATIMLTAHGNEEIAVEAMRFGAEDYINKTRLSLERLQQSIHSAVEKRQQQGRLSDTLTLQSNIFNKAVFYKRTKDIIEHPAGDRAAYLVQVQINEYQAIYRKHGLLLTDQYVTFLIKALARAILAEKLEMNIARMGDALISCLIYNCPEGWTGEKIADLLGKRAGQPWQADDDTTIASSVSIGVVVLGQGETVNAALDMVDAACQEAAEKKTGFVIYGKGTSPRAQSPAARPAQVDKEDKSGKPAPAEKITIDLVEIIKRNSIQPYFLPYIALSETATTFDASYFQMRMKLIGEDGTAFEAGDIKNMAIKSGDPGMLDLWATRFALAQILNVKKEQAGRNCGLFIRLFAESFTQDKLFEWMEKLIKKSRVPNIASTMVFEMRPPEFIGHKKHALNFINRMRDTWGASFALYDVINTTVLKTCVKQAGFEFIKFTMDGKNLKSIDEIGQSARDLGALTVIESISNAQELNSAIEMKFDYGQGDFIQPPLDQLVLMDDVIEI